MRFVLVLLACVACQNPAHKSRDGKVIFEYSCAPCHGFDGRAVATWKVRLGVPDLADPVVQGRLTDEQMAAAITNGSKNGNMPPWGKVLDQEQIAALVVYVRTLKQP
jgi:mono/diheme cytochrome c family protein